MLFSVTFFIRFFLREVIDVRLFRLVQHCANINTSYCLLDFNDLIKDFPWKDFFY